MTEQATTGAALASWDELDFAEFVPEVYAHYRPLVVGALKCFLAQLPPRRTEAILRGQFELPADAAPVRRLVRFLRFCPALHKLGQVLARHRELDPLLRQRLQRLETMAPRTAVELVEPAIRAELGDAIRQFQIELADAALAEGSVAVVVPITWRDRDITRRGVLKVLKPGVTDDLEQDLAILGRVADYLDQKQSAYRLHALAYRQTFDEVRELLMHEVNHKREQVNIAQAQRVYARCPRVWIPALLPFCTPRVTALQRIDGVKVTELPGRASRGFDLGRTIARSLLGHVLFSTQSSALFHADPHAGNLVAADDGRLAVLDWSLVGRLTSRDRRQLMQILVGALTADAACIIRAVAELSTGADGPAVRQRIVRSLACLPAGCLPSPDWLMQLLDSLAMAGVRFGGDLLHLRKTYFMLEGVLADTCPDWPLGVLLVSAMLERLASEWPIRAVRPLHDRNYPTSLSTADLLRIGAAAPVQMLACATARWMQLTASAVAPAAVAQGL